MTLHRIAILGAESSGKSTLAEALAKRHGTMWVPEYLREFVDEHGRTPLEHEQLHIAQTQVEREEYASALATRFLFCDTTPLMTEIYSRYCFGRPDVAVRMLATQQKYALILVAAPDCPWEPDGLQRSSDAVRQEVHKEVVRTLLGTGLDYRHVGGELAQRIEAVDALLSQLP